MSDVYENIVIGNFLVGLGAEIQKRKIVSLCKEKAKNKEQVSFNELLSINLLQQTPLDATLADVMITNSRSLPLILEFKRTNSLTGLSKEHHISEALKPICTDNVDLLEFSRNYHWFIESQLEQHDFKCYAREYLNVREEKTGCDLLAFISKAVDLLESTDIQINQETIQLYLAHLKAIKKAKNDASGSNSGGSIKSRNISSGGLVVNINRQGNLTYIPFDDVLELNLEMVLSKYLERQNQLQLQIQQTVSKKVTKSQGMSR